MKRKQIFFILLFVITGLIFLFSSCEYPKGDQGEQGEQGDTGLPGLPGESENGTPLFTFNYGTVPWGAGKIIQNLEGGVFPKGTEIEITSIPFSGYKFVTWWITFLQDGLIQKTTSNFINPIIVTVNSNLYAAALLELE